MKIQMKLKDIVMDDKLVEQTGMNRYAVAEGADGEAYVAVEVKTIVLEEKIT